MTETWCTTHGLPVVILGWFSTSLGGQESEPREFCATCCEEWLDREDYPYIRGATFRPVDAENPWVPDGMTVEGTFDVDGPYGRPKVVHRTTFPGQPSTGSRSL